MNLVEFVEMLDSGPVPILPAAPGHEEHNDFISPESIIDFSFNIGSLQPVNDRPVIKMKLYQLLNRIYDQYISPEWGWDA